MKVREGGRRRGKGHKKRRVDRRQRYTHKTAAPYDYLLLHTVTA